jgi:hypothetical protein
MDFMNRSTPPPSGHQSTPAAPINSAPNPTLTAKQSKHKSDQPKPGRLFRAGAVALLFALTVLAVSVIGMIYVTNSNNDQSKFVDSSKYQAVFLTNGQVYFGKLAEVSKDYFRLTNIYYLTQNTSTDSKGNTTTDGNYTLVKLGCQQIHDPFDQMVVQRSQISFWENLQSDGKVVKSIGDYQTQNKGKTTAQICATTSTQTQASDTTSTQGGSATTGTGTTTKTP